MNATLVGKGINADKGLMSPRQAIGHFINETGECSELLQLLRRDAAVDSHLQLQVGDDRDEIGIATALANTVDGALNMLGTNTCGCQSAASTGSEAISRNPSLTRLNR